MVMRFTPLAVLCMLFQFCSCSSGLSIDSKPVAAVNVNRYLGNWYEIARFDHSFEHDMTNCIAYYALNDDGTISVTNRGMIDGKPKVSTGTAKLTETPGLLRVSFFWPFYSDYRILMLPDDYSYALVGSDTDKYLWILSRTPKLPDGKVMQILREATRRGYDTSSLIWVDQANNAIGTKKNR